MRTWNERKEKIKKIKNKSTGRIIREISRERTIRANSTYQRLIKELKKMESKNQKSKMQF